MFKDFCTIMCGAHDIFRLCLLIPAYMVLISPQVQGWLQWLQFCEELAAKQKMVYDPYNISMKPLHDAICSLMYICSLLNPVLFYILRQYIFSGRRCRYNWTCQCSALESSPELLDLKDCASGQLQTGFTLHCASGPIAPCSQELYCQVTQFGTVK